MLSPHERKELELWQKKQFHSSKYPYPEPRFCMYCGQPLKPAGNGREWRCTECAVCVATERRDVEIDEPYLRPGDFMIRRSFFFQVRVVDHDGPYVFDAEQFYTKKHWKFERAPLFPFKEVDRK